MPKIAYDVRNWYWIVGAGGPHVAPDTEHPEHGNVYSSAGGEYVPIGDEVYVAWLADGNQPTRIANDQELAEVLAAQGLVWGKRA
jgi:hypothetical protein